MRDDVSWLGSLVEQPSERNARVWTAAVAAAPITPPSEIRNAATLADGYGSDREDVRAAFAARREAREAADENSRERRLGVLRAALARGDEPEQIREAWPTWWAIGSGSSTERQWHRDLAALKEQTMLKESKKATDARRERLREYLRDEGETKRVTLVGVLGYDKGRSHSAALQQLNGDLAAIGAGPLERNGRTVALAGQVPEYGAQPIKRAQPAAPATGPVRPSLADDAIRYVREGAAGPGVELPAAYCAALLERLS